MQLKIYIEVPKSIRVQLQDIANLIAKGSQYSKKVLIEYRKDVLQAIIVKVLKSEAIDIYFRIIVDKQRSTIQGTRRTIRFFKRNYLIKVLGIKRNIRVGEGKNIDNNAAVKDVNEGNQRLYLSTKIVLVVWKALNQTTDKNRLTTANQRGSLIIGVAIAKNRDTIIRKEVVIYS